MKYSVISKNRNLLMGLAMIFVMIFHSNIYFENSIIGFIKNHLFMGVDIFIFLSGIGMIYSLKKNNKNFIKRRLKRILPVYLPIVILFSFLFYILGYFSEIDFYANITFTNFLLKIGNFPVWYWYIPSILILYIITPFIYNYYYSGNKDKNFLVLIFSSILLILVTIPSKLNYLLVFTTRIPIYLMGIRFGDKAINESKIFKINIVGLIIMSIISMLILFFNESNYGWYSNVLSNIVWLFPVILLCIICAFIFEKIKKYYSFPLLSMIGGLTLEIYSIHERLLVTFSLIIGLFFPKFQCNIYLYNSIIIFLTVLISYLYNKTMKLLIFEKSREVVK